MNEEMTNMLIFYLFLNCLLLFNLIFLFAKIDI